MDRLVAVPRLGPHLLTTLSPPSPPPSPHLRYKETDQRNRTNITFLSFIWNWLTGYYKLSFVCGLFQVILCRIQYVMYKRIHKCKYPFIWQDRLDCKGAEMCIVGTGQIDSEESIQSHPTSLKLNITPNAVPLAIRSRTWWRFLI